ncbi:ABC transporter substrate-binding protein [Arenibaculum sp.]|uniref:ABC transporter substrate-binding protein n=1 Tax=Arenibaculum sp. TaxID=2865862 RepID=UPI002E105F23|nr:ABC transporter substrate-binding protein [Arenibaculum sp.]
MKKLLLAAAVLAGAMTALPAGAETITVALIRLSSSGPLFIAQEKGHFAAEGLDVEFVYADAASKVPVAVVSGDADFGVTGLTGGFYNLAGKGALKIIGAQSREEPGYNLVAYMANPDAFDAGLKTPDDIEGRTIGITTVGSTFHYSVGALAGKAGFDLASVRLVPLQSLGNMGSALTGKQVDGVLAPANVAYKLEGEGAGRIIGWVGDVTPWQLGALFTSTRTIEERRDLVERFVRAYRKGAADYHAAFLGRGADGKPVQGERYDEMLAVLAEYTQQPAAQIAQGLPYIDPEGRLDVGSIHDQIAWWQEQGQVDASVRADDILDLTFVDGHFNLPAR